MSKKTTTRRASRRAAPRCSLWLVYHKGEPVAAYPREKMAQVYASGYSRSGDVRIVAGTFTPNDAHDRQGEAR
jgi:hypothetical protein